MQMPKGIGIIASFHAFGAIFLLISILISIPIIIGAFFDDIGLGFLATLDTVWDLIMISIHAGIVAALFSRKKWSRNLLITLSGIELVFGTINLLSGNMFALYSIIVSCVIITYMRKQNVKKWLNDETI